MATNKKLILANAPVLMAFIAGSADIVAASVPAAGETPKRPTFTMLAYTGGTLRVPGFPLPIIVDLATLRAAASVTVLFDHNPREVVGLASNVKINAGGVEAAGMITGDDGDPVVKKILDNARNGFKWPVSVGVMPGTVQQVEAGQRVTVNGRTFTGPVLVARHGVLREISFVGIGADETASAKIAASAAGVEMKTFEEWLKEKGFDVATLNADQKAGLQASYDAEIKASAGGGTGGGDPDPTNDAAIQAQAQATTTAIRAAASVETARIDGIRKIEGCSTELQAKAITEGWTVEKTELESLRAGRTNVTAHQPLRGDRARMATAVITAALCISAGMTETFVAAGIPTTEREQVMNLAQAREHRGASLQMLMDQTIRAAGGNYTGSRKDNGFIRAAFEAEATIAASGFSTMSLSGILSNVANKQMLASYQAVEAIWPFICAIRSHGDFKVHTQYRLDSTGAFKKVGPDGELKHVGLTDAAFTNQLATFGALIALTRQMMINDDLVAFLQIPSFLGRMAATRLEEAVFVLLLSNPTIGGNAFFSVANRNLLTGAGSALAISGLTDSEATFANQVDGNRKPILATPTRILVGTNKKVTAESLYAEKLLITGENATITSNNPHAGKYTPKASPYVNNTAIRDQDGVAITGQTQTGWWMFGDPAVRAAIAVAFLNGQRVPIIESATSSFETLGMQWRAFQDFGVGLEDPNGAVYNAGA